MATKKWLIDFDMLVSCTMVVEADSEDAARSHLSYELRLTAGSFCEEYGHTMELQEDSIVIQPDDLEGDK
jgi:hypothetical protein